MDPNVAARFLSVLGKLDKYDVAAVLSALPGHNDVGEGVVSAALGDTGDSLGVCTKVKEDPEASQVAVGVKTKKGVGSVSSFVPSEVDSQESVSWADVMNEVEEMQEKAVESVPAVSMPQYTYCDAVKKINFISPSESPQPGFQATYVRSAGNKALLASLARLGIKVPRACHAEFALARYTLASVPDAFVRGKERLKSLALVGDKVMALVMVDEAYSAGGDSLALQGKVSSVLSSSRLSRICVRSGWIKHIVMPAGVDPMESRPAGEAVEAIAGAIYHAGGVGGVAKFMTALQLL